MFYEPNTHQLGENLPFLEEEYEVATENGGFQMNGRWSEQSHSTVEIGQCRWREGDCIVKVLLRTHYPYSGTVGRNGNEMEKE